MDNSSDLSEKQRVRGLPLRESLQEFHNSVLS
jgi:hypothetical protein